MTNYEPSAGEHISQTAEQIVAMANETGQPVTARFNDTDLIANPGDDAANIAAGYSAEMARQSEEWRTSEAGKQWAREKEERRKIAERAEAEGILPFRFRDDEAKAFWDQGLAAQSSGDGQATYRYAARWAAWMEQRLRDGEGLADAVKTTEFEADLEGISGFMASYARRMLERVWFHGEQLRALEAT